METKELERKDLDSNGSISLPRLLALVGIECSMSNARRSIEGGSVKIDGITETDPRKMIQVSDQMIVQVGKQKCVRIFPS